MGLAESIPQPTVEDYLTMEQVASAKHEYVDGVIRAMSGGTLMHSRIKVNLVRELSQRLHGRSCEPFDSDLRIAIPKRRSYFYPDASVICGPPEFDKQDKHSVTNPTAVFEVLSASTESFDRKQKLIVYRQCPSLRDYVLINHDLPVVEIYHRDSEGQWFHMAYTDLATVAHISSIAVDLPLAGLYQNVEFPPPPPSTPVVVREDGTMYFVD